MVIKFIGKVSSSNSEWNFDGVDGRSKRFNTSLTEAMNREWINYAR